MIHRSRRAVCGLLPLLLALALGGCGTARSLPAAVQLPVGKISVGAKVAVSADGARAYLTAEDGIEVIDTATKAVLGVLRGSGYSYSKLAISSDGRWLYVGTSGGVVPIELTTHLTRDAMPGATGLLAVSPDGARVVSTVVKSVRVRDAAGGAELANVPLDADPEGDSTLEVSPDGRRVYLVTDYESGRVLAVDLDGRGVSEIKIPTESAISSRPNNLQLSPDGRRLYVQAWRLHVVDTATREVVDSYSTGTSTSQLVMSPNGRYLFAISGLEGEIKVIDASDGDIVGTGWVVADSKQVYPGHAAISPDGRRLYVPTRESLAVIDTSQFS